MAAILDPAQRWALKNEAIPILEELAANDQLRNRIVARFDHRNAHHNDRAHWWKWTWQDDHQSAKNERRLVANALELRRNLRRGEKAPVARCLVWNPTRQFPKPSPFSSLGPDSSPNSKKPRIMSGQKYVIDCWKERGDWRDEFNSSNWVESWKWRHESPFPEPEDLSHFVPADDPRYGPLPLHPPPQFDPDHDDNPFDSMDLTPSEADVLEAIDLPASEQPKKF
ncbi:hypothetical protein B0T24DRAFT_677020 [Lasiosphaeria ovina]|uniref:Uncharacterized protein n=1 Tax=Lasiosphaeria ovina TaxID=92902 RepID=A0AAE0KFZ2_9PEZI|nr:hypothetical protein B0T24DRAFT_677020 [Lasiosphaeria ovina]